MRGLLIGDEAEKLVYVSDCLSSFPIAADAALGWVAGLRLAACPIYDVIGVLLSPRPELDGLLTLQEHSKQVPVIGFASTTQLLPTSDVLQAGAADLITMPFNAEAIARLHAVLRRSYGLLEGKLTVGPITIELANRCVSVRGARVHFTNKEYELIEMLGLRRDRAVPKKAIAARLLGVADQRTMRRVDDYISGIRKKLRFTCEGIDLIQTHLERSYILSSGAGTGSRLQL